MSARVYSAAYPLKETQTKSIYTYKEDYYPSKHEHLFYRNRSKLVDYDSNDYRSYDECDDFVRKVPLNDSRPRRSIKAGKDDVDRLYRQSKEKFASWDIRDLDDRRRVNEIRSLSGKSNRRLHREQPEAEVEDVFANGDSSSSPTPTRRRNGTLRREKRSNSTSRRSTSESLDRQSGMSRERRSTSCSEDDDEKHRRLLKRGNNRRHYQADVMRSGSVKRKNEKNAGLNRGFRAFIDKFRSKSADKDRKKAQRAWRREPLTEVRGYDGLKEKRSPSKEIYPLKESKGERNHQTKEYEYRNNEMRGGRSSDDEKPRVKVYKLKYHEIKQEPRRSSPEDENSYHRSKDLYLKENDDSKRRSYAFESSPGDFEVTTQKYERNRRNEAEVHRRSSFSDKGHRDSDSSQRSSLKDHNRPKVVRKISFQDRQHESIKTKPIRSRVSERHSRPLTPPKSQSPLVLKEIEEELPKHDNRESPIPMTNHQDNIVNSRDKENSKKEFSMKDWYESNRQFASKYLKEHSKVKELSTFSDVSAKDEFVFGSPKDSKIFYEIERHEVREESIEEDTDDSYVPLTYEKIPIKIEDSKSRAGKNLKAEDIGRKYYHESFEEEDEQLKESEENKEKDKRHEITKKSEKQGRSFVMPSRRLWNYRDGV